MKNSSKKTNLNASRQNAKKKTVVTSTKKTTSKTTAFKKTDKVAKAEALRVQSVKDMNKLARIPRDWTIKLKNCRTPEERKKTDAHYGEKFKKAEKVEQASYKAYYDYVSKNFTAEQQKTAMAKSKDFMSKKYTNALGRKTDEKQ
ncbi:MAG: hypothetical protein IJF76_04400 [Clostridia bacterium]|nr:hypothetical protein [Clostridia bacterium]